MAVKIKNLKLGGVAFYPKTVDKAVTVTAKGNKTLDVVIGELEDRDVTVDPALDPASGNAIANKAVNAAINATNDIVTANLKKFTDFQATKDKLNGYVTLTQGTSAAPKIDDKYLSMVTDSKITSAYLPSYVDDVLEFSDWIATPLTVTQSSPNLTGKSYSIVYSEVLNKFLVLYGANYYNSVSGLPSGWGSDGDEFSTPVAGKIYTNTKTNKVYRWGGTELTEISASLAIGDKAGMAYDGKKGEDNRLAIAALGGKISTIEGEIAQIPENTTNIATNANNITTLQNKLKGIVPTTPESNSIEYTALDTLIGANAVGVYLVTNGGLPAGHLFVERPCNTEMAQTLIGNFNISSTGTIDSSHNDGNIAILYRFYNAKSSAVTSKNGVTTAASSWSKWVALANNETMTKIATIEAAYITCEDTGVEV